MLALLLCSLEFICNMPGLSDGCLVCVLCVSLRTGKQEAVQKTSTVTQLSSTPQRWKKIFCLHVIHYKLYYVYSVVCREFQSDGRRVKSTGDEAAATQQRSRREGADEASAFFARPVKIRNNRRQPRPPLSNGSGQDPQI